MKTLGLSLLLVTAISLATLTMAKAQTIISVNLGGPDASTLGSSEVAGAVPAANFNNFATDPGAYAGYSGMDPFVLNDSTGTVSSVELTSYITGASGGTSGNTSAITPQTPQLELFDGGLNNNFGPANFTLTGLSAFSSYSIYVYYNAYAFGGSRFGTLSIAPNSQLTTLPYPGGPNPAFLPSQSFYVGGSSNTLTAYTQATNTTFFDTTNPPGSLPSGSLGNYVLFSGLNGDTQTVTYYNNNNNVDLVGFQIVGTLAETPEPSTWAMMVGGLLLLVGLQRFRRSKI